jgi:hypothetical protein
MKKKTTMSLKPCEGYCIQLPNGDPALQFISYRDVKIETQVNNKNKVRIIVDFDKPFIKTKG